MEKNKIKEFNANTIFDIITYLKNNNAIQIFMSRSGKTYKTKLLSDRESLLFQLYGVQLELERIEKEV